MRVTVRDPSRKVNYLSKVVCDRKIVTEFTRSISSIRKGYPVLMTDVNVPKDKQIGLTERASSMLDEIATNTVQKEEDGN